MKRLVYAVTADNIIKNPVEDDPAVERAFKRLYRDSGENSDGFIRSIGSGIGNGDLPRALANWYDSHNDKLIDVARQYAEYRDATRGMKQKRRSYDIEGADEAVAKLVDSVATVPITLEKEKTEKLGNTRQIWYRITVVPFSPYCSDNPYSSYTCHFCVYVEPNVPFSIDFRREPTIMDDNSPASYAERITHYIKCIEADYKVYKLFIQKYHELVKTVCGEYLGVPQSEYINYLEASQHMGTGERKVMLHIGNKNDGAIEVAKLLYNNGYIDEATTEAAYGFLSPLFDSYGLDLILTEKYGYFIFCV